MTAAVGWRCLRTAAWPATGAPELLPLKYASDEARRVYTLVTAWPELAAQLPSTAPPPAAPSKERAAATQQARVGAAAPAGPAPAAPGKAPSGKSPSGESTQPVLGLYHALGQEKLQATDRAIQIATQEGFDALKPTKAVFQYSPYGVSACLAIAVGAQGPYYVLEGDALSGIMATHQALTDIRIGHTERALVLSTGAADHAWALLFAASAADRFAWGVRFCRGGAEPPREALQSLEAELGASPQISMPLPDDVHGLAAVTAAVTACQDDAGGTTAHGVWCVTPAGRGALMCFAARKGEDHG